MDTKEPSIDSNVKMNEFKRKSVTQSWIRVTSFTHFLLYRLIWILQYMRLNKLIKLAERLMDQAVSAITKVKILSIVTIKKAERLSG